MSEYKFKIHGELLIEGMDKININPANIVCLTRISNYLEKNMPMILLHMNLDKNVFDKLLQNAKTATIHLNISKYDAGYTYDEAFYDTYIDDEFSIIVSNDINYNKELDYIEDDSLSETNTKKDVWRELNVGLISKSSIDANKIVSNGIFYDITIMDLIGYYMSSLHLLLEPFDYTETIKQLTIPPIDTLVKLVDYLNSIKVFYKTSYLLFIDEPYCTYLISRSGKGIKKNDDLYLDIQFDVKKVTDPEYAVQGMDKNRQTQQYDISLPVTQTKYTIDHDASKLVNEFETIVNPNTESDIFSSADIQSAKTYIERLIGTFRGSIQDYIINNTGLGGFMGSCAKEVANAAGYMNYLNQVQDNMIDVEINDMFAGLKTSVSVKVGDASFDVDLLSSSIKDIAASGLKSALGGFTSKLGEVQNLTNNLFTNVDQGIQAFNDIAMLDNRLASVSFINIQDTVAKTNQMLSGVASSVTNLTNGFMSQVTEKMSSVTGVLDTMSNLTDTIDNLDKAVKIMEAAEKFGLVSGQHPDQQKFINRIKENNNKIKGVISEVRSECDRIQGQIQSVTDCINGIANQASSLATFGDALNKIASMNVKAKFNSLVPDTRDITASNGILGSLSTLFQSLSSSGSISFSDISKIVDNLDNVADIDSIGKLGLSNFAAKLNVGATSNGKVGKMILKAKNDNPNMIKNIKSEMENMVNQLSINKVNIDPSVFTPNKRYKVKNYDAHSDKDGLFILNKKTEIYKREAENFYCKTILDFSKIMEPPSTNESQNNDSGLENKEK